MPEFVCHTGGRPCQPRCSIAPQDAHSRPDICRALGQCMPEFVCHTGGLPCQPRCSIAPQDAHSRAQNLAVAWGATPDKSLSTAGRFLARVRLFLVLPASLPSDTC